MYIINLITSILGIINCALVFLPSLILLLFRILGLWDLCAVKDSNHHLLNMLWKLVFALALTVSFSHGKISDEEVKIQFTKIVMKCQKDHPVEINELMALQNLQVPKNKDSKCLLACAYKAEGSMNDKGMYDLDHAYKVAEKTQEGDDKRLVNAKKLADICAKVNDETVSDGEKGCERAALIFKCVIDNAPKLGFKV